MIPSWGFRLIWLDSGLNKDLPQAMFGSGWPGIIVTQRRGVAACYANSATLLRCNPPGNFVALPWGWQRLGVARGNVGDLPHNSATWRPRATDDDDAAAADDDDDDDDEMRMDDE